MSSNEKSQFFVSIVLAIGSDKIENVNRLEELQNYLDERYSDYEILLLVKRNAQPIIQQKIEKILKAIPAIRYLQLTNDVPDDVALAAGLENSIGDFIVLYDPLTDPIDNIAKAIEMCRTGSDVVVGTAKTPSSLMYSLIRPCVNWLLTSIDYRLPKNATSFRCLSRRAANSVMSIGSFHQQFFMRIQKSGYQANELRYDSHATQPKTFAKGFREVMRLMVFNSFAPLRLMSVLGLIGSTLACLISLYAVIVRFVKDDVVSGWASTVLIISLIAVVQFIILSFISEYLVRLLTEHSRHNDYSVVFEKNSSVMVNQDRINVLESSTSNKDINLVQTGRNK